MLIFQGRKETNDVLSKPNFRFHSKTDHNRKKPISFRTGQQFHKQPVLNPDCANGKQKFLRYNRDCTLRTSSFCKHRSISGSIFQIESHCSPRGFDQQIMQLLWETICQVLICRKIVFLRNVDLAISKMLLSCSYSRSYEVRPRTPHDKCPSGCFNLLIELFISFGVWKLWAFSEVTKTGQKHRIDHQSILR